MKRTVEVLKKAGVIDKLQKHFDKIKPPVGISEDAIVRSINGCLTFELSRNLKLMDEIYDAMFLDASEAIKNALNIEYGELDEFINGASNILGGIFGNAIIVGMGKDGK